MKNDYSYGKGKQGKSKMKTNRYFTIVLVAVLVSAAVWIVAEAGVKSEPSVKNNESVKQNAEYPYLTPEDYKNFERIAMKSRLVNPNENQIDILKGFKAIGVAVENLTPEIERLGLTRQALQIDVELLLRKYGIEVNNTASFGYLYIQVSALPNDLLGIVVFNIIVQFCDTVIPIRNPRITIVNAKVWQEGSVGSVGKEKIGSIREAVEDHVKEFINDYLAANPIDRSAKQKTEKPEPEPKQ